MLHSPSDLRPLYADCSQNIYQYIQYIAYIQQTRNYFIELHIHTAQSISFYNM